MANQADSILSDSLSAPVAIGVAEDREDFDLVYDAFFREQYGALLRFLRQRSRTDEDAEDAAQESMARFARSCRDYPPASWKWALYRIAINVANDQLRKARTSHAQQHISLDSLEIESDEPSLEESAATAQQLALLSEAILALPPKCRQVYLLKRLRDMTSTQIAQHCGISVRAVDKHLAKALEHIRRRFRLSAPDTY